MYEKGTILIVDDDSHIRQVVDFALRKAGFTPIEAADGIEALKEFENQKPVLIILDILMPEMDGTDVCKRIRASSNVPIIFLSSKDDEIDRVLGLELGGDDYVTKPFSPRELVARVKAVLRRAAAVSLIEQSPSVPNSLARILNHDRLKLDLDRFQAFWEGNEVTLTVTEFGILRTMMGFPGKVFSRDELMDGAYDFDNVISDRTIDSHIRRIRHKFKRLGHDPIETVHGLGYRLKLQGSNP